MLLFNSQRLYRPNQRCVKINFIFFAVKLKRKKSTRSSSSSSDKVQLASGSDTATAWPPPAVQFMVPDNERETEDDGCHDDIEKFVDLAYTMSVDKGKKNICKIGEYLRRTAILRQMQNT